MSRPLVVLKFGSSVLRGHADLRVVAEEVKRHVDDGWSVVAIVSALGDTTESLIEQAYSLGAAAGPFAEDAGASRGPEKPAATPAAAAVAALLGTGEVASTALVGLALERIGLPFRILDAGRVGPFTRGPQLEATPHALDTPTVRRAIDECGVVVLPGFVGRDADGGFTLLGRGGSDLTALFVAQALGAERCRLVKDVDGIYEYDPRGAVRKPRRYATLSWDDALEVDGSLLQRRAAQFAFRNRLPFEVGACGGGRGTSVGAAVTSLRRLAS